MALPEKNTKILILDDNFTFQKKIGKLLWEEGYDLSFTDREDIFLKRLKILSFDIILINTGTEEIDYNNLCKKLCLGVEDEIPVIALIPPCSDFSPAYWLEKGLTDYLRGTGDSKNPWDNWEILAKVGNHIRFQKHSLVLKQRIVELEKSNLDKDNFYRILSHDLKAPFQGLVGLLEILHGEYYTLSKEEVQDYIRSIHDSTKRTYRLLENLLEWSGLQGGQLIWTPEETDLRFLVEDTIGFFKIGARDKKISLSCDVKPDSIVFTDRRMISSVIRNLVYNGLKFTDMGGEVVVRVKESVDYFEISVDDTGVGVHPDNLNRMLRSGDPESTPGTAQESGSGLGLKLCRQFVEKNGGQLWVRSEPGKGSSFRFSLPKRKVELSNIGKNSGQLLRSKKGKAAG